VIDGGGVLAAAGSYSPEGMEAMLLGGADDPVPYTNLVGPRRAVMLQQDADVKKHLPLRARGTEEYGRALEAFRNSPMTGCTTVLDQLRLRAGYNPAAPTQQSMTKFFFMELMQHPLFKYVPIPEDRMNFDVMVGSGKGQIDVAQIIKKFEGTDEEAAGRIRNQIERVMAAAIRSPGRGQEMRLIQEHSLSAGQQIQFAYISSTVKIAVTMLPPMNFITQAIGSRAGLHWTFDSENWPKHAEAVLQEHLKLVSDWLVNS